MKPNFKLIFIIILAALLRFYQLGNNPPSLDWDEVSLAYNAKGLLETGKDEYGNAWPITIRSFNDYKPSLYTYSLIPTLRFFGSSEFSIRFPSAPAGTLTVLITYFLVKALFVSERVRPSQENQRSWLFSRQAGSDPIKSLALLTSFLLAISPWHLQFSRIAFEANYALFFFVLGMLFLVKSQTKSFWLPLSAAGFGFSLLAYHSTKVVIPILLAVVILPKFKQYIKNNRTLITAILVSLMFIVPILRTVQLGFGQSRLASVSFTTIDNLLDQSRLRIERDSSSFLSRLTNHRYLVYAKEVIGGYVDHYDLNFWFVQGDSIDRHHAVGMGLLYWWELPFLLIGIIHLLGSQLSSRRIIFSWFLIAPAASMLTSGTPNSVRAIFFLPTFQIFISLGIFSIFNWLKHQPRPYWLLAIGYWLFIIANIATYFHNYYVHTPRETSQAWQYGYKQMVQWVMSQKDKYSQIVITNSYDQPYMYLLWYGNYSPGNWINNGTFGNGFDKFEFRSLHWDQDLKLTRTLIIGTPDEIKDKSKAIWSVNFLDGTPAFLAVPSQGI